MQPEDPRTATWAALRDLVDRVSPSPAYRQVARWAFDVLEQHLGRSWPQRAIRQNEGELLLALHRVGSHPMALAQALDWALALTDVRDLNGFGDLRADLHDTRAARMLHTELQLVTAAHALRLGRSVQLEPRLEGAASPADLAIRGPDGMLVVEARVLTESDRGRSDRTETDEVIDRVKMTALSHGTWLSGTFSRLPSQVELRLIEEWIGHNAAVVMAEGPASLALPCIALRLSARDAATGRLNGPALQEQLLPRIARAVADKADTMHDSKATWLRIVLLIGVWRFTAWGVSPLHDKAIALRNALAASGSVPPGVVVSSAAGRYDGLVPEESVRVDAHTAAVRRAVAPGRARETLIMSFDESPEAVDEWVALADAERDWLPYALERHGLPDWDSIAGPAPS